MDRSKGAIWRFTLMLLLFYGSTCGYAQSVSRQSINSSGSNTITNGLLIRQSVGQPYFTKAQSVKNVRVRPGFQQPGKLKISSSTLNSDFNIQVSIYPNPATTSIALESAESISEARVQVVDIKGNMIWQESFSDFRKSDIQVRDWQEGVYFLTLIGDNSRKHTSKLIITK